jgi:oxygen-independent coproporphyrinogen-3 oxidase
MHPEIGIYIHIPFCIQKCHYCDFCSYSGIQDKMEDYIDALVLEMKLWKEKMKGYIVKSIFIGGGTPSLMSIPNIKKIFNTLYSNFNILSSCEISIECNPGTLNADKMKCYLNNGVNRLSIGLQAWQNRILKQLGRIHNKQQFIENYSLARQVGFKNINIDLMFSLPDQKLKDWKETLSEVVKLNPDHISAYSLNIENSTLFGKWYNKGVLNLPSEEEDRKMYHFAIDYLIKQGYEHYEISNFSRKKREGIHNKNYWENGQYIGFGLAAHSHIGYTRFSNTEVLEEYLKRIRQMDFAVIQHQENTLQDEIAETMFLGLRMMKGINRENFKKRFGFDPFQKYINKIKKLQKEKLLQFDHEVIQLTQKGIDVSNRVFVEFLPD